MTNDSSPVDNQTQSSMKSVAFDISEWTRNERTIQGAALFIFTFQVLTIFLLTLAFTQYVAAYSMITIIGGVIFAVVWSLYSNRFITRYKSKLYAALIILLFILSVFMSIGNAGMMAFGIIQAIILLALIIPVARSLITILINPRFSVPTHIRRLAAEAADSSEKETLFELTENTRRPQPATRVKAPWGFVCYALIIVGISVLFMARTGPRLADTGFGIWLGTFLQANIGFGLWGLGAWARRHGRRAAVASAGELMAKDLRAPIFLFRSFADDGLTTLGRTARSLNPADMQSGMMRFEEAIAVEMSAWGPVITIGQPGEKLPELGAARFYENDDTWRDAITKAVKHASVIVIAAARTKGLDWEVNEIKRADRVGDAIIIVPPVEHAETIERWRHYENVAGMEGLAGLAASHKNRTMIAAVTTCTGQFAVIFSKTRTQTDYELAIRLAMWLGVRRPQ